MRPVPEHLERPPEEVRAELNVGPTPEYEAIAKRGCLGARDQLTGRAYPRVLSATASRGATR
jgi:hypothetical protein